MMLESFGGETRAIVRLVTRYDDSIITSNCFKSFNCKNGFSRVEKGLVFNVSETSARIYKDAATLA